jgi:uncharacterized protein YecA (UPF0149 family)
MGFLSKLFNLPSTPPESARKLGRNARCWCGSGKKYKHCHHEDDQAYFARTRPAACTSYG